jgi:hypothetical protein
MDPYEVKSDKDSGILSDANDWSDDPPLVARAAEEDGHSGRWDREEREAVAAAFGLIARRRHFALPTTGSDRPQRSCAPCGRRCSLCQRGQNPVKVMFRSSRWKTWHHGGATRVSFCGTSRGDLRVLSQGGRRVSA